MLLPPEFDVLSGPGYAKPVRESGRHILLQGFAKRDRIARIAEIQKGELRKQTVEKVSSPQ